MPRLKPEPTRNPDLDTPPVSLILLKAAVNRKNKAKILFASETRHHD